MAKRRKATAGWLGLATYVSAYDTWALLYDHETLSGACWRGLMNPKARLPIALIILITTKHLLAPKVLPQIDPFNKVSEVLRGKRSVK